MISFTSSQQPAAAPNGQSSFDVFVLTWTKPS